MFGCRLRRLLGFVRDFGRSKVKRWGLQISGVQGRLHGLWGGLVIVSMPQAPELSEP